MEISFLGNLSIKLKGKNALVNTDPFEVVADKIFKIEYPGEYEVAGVSIIGIPNDIFVVEIDGLRVAYLKNLVEKLSIEQLEEIGSVDVLLIPVMDAKLSAEVVKQVDPWIAIPMKYQDVSEFLKVMDKPNLEPVAKLSVTADRLPNELTVVWLSKK